MNVMNASVSCGGGKEQSVLILFIREEDNATVPPDMYTGSLRIAAKEDNGKPVVEELFFDYEITIQREAAGNKPSGPAPREPDIDRERPREEGPEPRKPGPDH